MDIQTLTAFFMWCTVFNAAAYAWAAIWFIVAPDFIHRVQDKMFPLPRATFDAIV